MIFEQSKKEADKFLRSLSLKLDLHAPVKDIVTNYKLIKNFKSISELSLKENSFFPIKEHFFAKKETIFNFNKDKLANFLPKNKEKAFFGLRKCDLNAIKKQDLVFLSNDKDGYYEARRKNTYLIGYQCKKACNQYCFCGSMNLEDFFDLMYYDKGGKFLIEAGSEKGLKLIKKYKKHFKKTKEGIKPEDKVIKNANRLERKDLNRFYEDSRWKNLVDLCLSCAACTNLCPTCYCFEFHDKVKISNLSQGSRTREWSSCQLKSFSKVAGEFVFRTKREERFKHRIYHQLQYFKEKYGTDLCVGCGRCILACPTRIDFVKLINEMK